MSRYVSPVETITDLNGAPMVGAKLVFYETGTATLKTVYSDSGLSVPLANPVTAVSSGAGAIYPDIYLDGIYKVVQQDDTGTAGVADGAVLWTRDPVGAIATGNFETWLNDSTYSIPEVVYASDDNYYISLVDDNQGNEPSVSPSQWQLIPVKDMVGLTETQTLTNKHIPVIYDSNGNEVVIYGEVESAVNEITETNAASGNKPSINQTGTDDVGLDIEGVILHNNDAEGKTLTINDVDGTARSLSIQTAGLNRWLVRIDGVLETGGNTGSALRIQSRNDDGTALIDVLNINRATGLFSITNLAPGSAGTAIAGQATGDLGTEAFLVSRTIGSGFFAGADFAGSALAYYGINTDGTAASTITGGVLPVALSGTWRARGTSALIAGYYPVTVFTKVAN